MKYTGVKITLYLTQSERDAWGVAADNTRMTLAAWIRQAISRTEVMWGAKELPLYETRYEMTMPIELKLQADHDAFNAHLNLNSYIRIRCNKELEQ